MHNDDLVQLHSRFMANLICSKEWIFDAESRASDFKFFHDCCLEPEVFYTDNILSILKYTDSFNIEKAHDMIKVRTYKDFYLQYYVMSFIFGIIIYYLADK